MIRILFSTSLIFVLRTAAVTELLSSKTLFSTTPTFVFKTAVAAKPLVSGIFDQHLDFFLNSLYLCCIDLCKLR